MNRDVPSREKCISLMKSQGMLPNIIRHSLTVEKVALFLSHALRRSGEDLNLPEIIAAALLHDITKTRSIQTHENHALTGETLLKELGYPRIGEIVRYHIEIPPAIFNGRPISPEEIVNYADKRVLHNAVVSLAERFQDLRKRYGGTTTEACSRLRMLEKHCYLLEKKIFSKIDFDPEALPGFVCDKV